MTRTHSPRIVGALLPLIVAPLVILVSTDVLAGLPDFVRGVIDGAAIAVLLGFCVSAGSALGAARRRADDAKLDGLDPLGGLSRDDDDTQR